MWTFRRVNTEQQADDPTFATSDEALIVTQLASTQTDDVYQVIDEYGDVRYLVWGGWVYSG